LILKANKNTLSNLSYVHFVYIEYLHESHIFLSDCIDCRAATVIFDYFVIDYLRFLAIPVYDLRIYSQRLLKTSALMTRAYVIASRFMA